jgi:membrane fusion protein (multidrug efflux system)
VEVGQLVQPGQALMAVIPLDRVWITANFKETQVEHIRPGQRVSIRADAIAARRFQGRSRVSPPATGARFSLLPPDNSTGNYVKVVQRIPVASASTPVRIRNVCCDPACRLCRRSIRVNAC